MTFYNASLPIQQSQDEILLPTILSHIISPTVQFYWINNDETEKEFCFWDSVKIEEFVKFLSFNFQNKP